MLGEGTNRCHGSTPMSEACDDARSRSFNSGMITILYCMDLMYLKPDASQGPSRKWQHDDSVEDLEGNNDGHTSNTNEGDGNWHLPLKLQASQGRVAARHYENSVKEILKLAAGLFCACLVAQNIYPDRVMQITWAKEVWIGACKHLEIKITHNNDIIQLVWFSTFVCNVSALSNV